MKDAAPQALIISTRADMIAEAKSIVDAARAKGIVLRILGGLATRVHCQSLDFCERDHSDIDLIAHRRDVRRILGLFTDMGYDENLHVREATGNRQLQYTRPCRHGEEWSPYRLHDEDHVDVFLDTFKLEHAVDLSGRLELDDYTITPSDALLIKLQMAHLEEKDERDVFTILRDLPLDNGGPRSDGQGVDDESRGGGRGGTRGADTAGGSPEAIDVAYLARLCAHEWGLFHDVEFNLARLKDDLSSFGVEPETESRVQKALADLELAIQAEPKSQAWRLRARIGTHWRWRNLVEEQA